MILAGTGGLVTAATIFVAESARRRRKSKAAVCVITHGYLTGYVELESVGNMTRFTCHIKGFKRDGKHGMHVHAKGDLREGCNSTCSHYNPQKESHGEPVGAHRHRGDLGNIVVENRECHDTVLAEIDVDEIIGRSLLVHKDEDNLGLPGTRTALETGDAGERIGCGVIGRID